MILLHHKYLVLTFLLFSSENYAKSIRRQFLSRFKRVVNGSFSHSSNWPWLVSIKNYPLRKYLEKENPKYMNWSTVGNDSHICGASLIGRNWIVSAAHCLEYERKVYKNDWIASLGAFDLGYGGKNRQIIKIDKVWFFENSTDLNDIVLMHLSQPVNITDYIKPICVANTKLNAKNLECIGMGWGSTISIEKNSLSPLPKYFYAKYINYRDPICLHDGLDTRTICFSPINGVSCRGDSGGPMVCRNNKNDQWVLVGITSSGTGCTKLSDKMIYTNVSYYYSSLKFHIGEKNFCNNSTKTQFSIVYFLFLVINSCVFTLFTK